jgi:hypothetical protein
MEYPIDTQFLFSSGIIDMQRTIDKTLRNWLSIWGVSLLRLGIIPELKTTNSTSPYYNCLNLKTEFPNVPLTFNVLVGTTANFYIEHTILSFFEVGSYVDIIINDRNFGILFNNSISETLDEWIDEYADLIQNLGILVDKFGNTLKFNVRNQNQRFDLNIRPGLSQLPGELKFNIIKKLKGNLGTIITSNEIYLDTDDYEQIETLIDGGFSTGMITQINGTIYPLQNVGYNILFLTDNKINLSYEGPFWGFIRDLCTNSPFVTVAFNIGFGQTACSPDLILNPGGGMFNNDFNNDFSLNYINTTEYDVNVYETFQLSGGENMKDIIRIEPTNKFYVLADDILVYDSISSNYIQTIEIEDSDNLKFIFNTVDNFVWIITETKLIKVDPYLNQKLSETVISSLPHSISYNTINGDVYVTTDTSILIFNNGILLNAINQPSWELAFNEFENLMYVSLRSDILVRINGNTRQIQNQYNINSLTSSPLVYDPQNEAVYIFADTLYKIDNNILTQISAINSSSFNNMIFNILTETINTSTNIPQLSSIELNDDIKWSITEPIWGYQVINFHDGDIYISDQNSSQIVIIDNNGGFIKHIVSIDSNATKGIYIPNRNATVFLEPNQNRLVEIIPTLASFFTVEQIQPKIEITDDMFGTLNTDFIYKNYLWLNVEDFIRTPRENFVNEPDVEYYWKWYSDNIPEFFMYDFTGEQLSSDGPLAYKGPKPLSNAILNRNTNRNIEDIYDPKSQQTIFPVITKKLDFVNSDVNIDNTPKPLELFIGFNSQLEGGIRSILQLYKKENIDFTINPNDNYLDKLKIETVTVRNGDVVIDRYGRITLDIMSDFVFTNDEDGNTRGLKPGQHLAIFIKDVTNIRNQYISENNGYLVKIRQVFQRELIVDFFKPIDKFKEEYNIIENYPNENNTTKLSFRFKVWDKEIGRFNVYGQTEIEDIRYKIELNNIGKLVSSDDVYIFKEYDIKEDGIDWVFLNKKRKEMLMMKHLIYPYIGSYKSIINAINYFGYNDLELYEYYRNINVESENYFKLHKVEIPDIFDNTVEGWKENDFIINTFPNESYEETNLFNLTYRITDKEGNKLLTYSLEEVQKKLQGLKYWLQENIIPITHKILDISGRTDFVSVNTVSHKIYDLNIFNIKENFTPVSFKLNELNLYPVNNGSTVYNCVLDIYLQNTNNLPDCYTIDIKTYEIYREWWPLKNYMKGDKIVYFDKLYESFIDDNKTNNPRKYENISDWQIDTIYDSSDIVKYDREFYIYTAFGTASNINPKLDTENWINITEWKEIDLKPIQYISETRNVKNVKPFNFTIDSNIDPYLTIEITSSNGYGLIYKDKKNYEIRSILDIQELESYTNLTSKKYRDLNTNIIKI